jgi:hypothetical protein
MDQVYEFYMSTVSGMKRFLEFLFLNLCLKVMLNSIIKGEPWQMIKTGFTVNLFNVKSMIKVFILA